MSGLTHKQMENLTLLSVEELNQLMEIMSAYLMMTTRFPSRIIVYFFTYTLVSLRYLLLSIQGPYSLMKRCFSGIGLCKHSAEPKAHMHAS